MRTLALLIFSLSICQSQDTVKFVATPIPVQTLASESHYFRPFYLGSVTSNVIHPFSVTFKSLPASSTMVKSVRRFSFGVDTTYKSMDTLSTISGQVVTVKNFKASNDSTGSGLFRVQVIAKDSAGRTQDEANVIVRVIY